jgi:hypothetical protein
MWTPPSKENSIRSLARPKVNKIVLEPTQEDSIDKEVNMKRNHQPVQTRGS